MVSPFLTALFALDAHEKGASPPATGQGYPYKKTQKGGYRRLPVRRFFGQAFYATATGSFALRLRFGFSASVVLSAS